MSATLDTMSARTVDEDMKAAAAKLPELIISADGHVDEPIDLWSGLPEEAGKYIPKRIAFDSKTRPGGGTDPKLRIEHMDLDGVAAEVIYPTAALRLFALPRETQEAAFPVYNDWLADYCKHDPKRLFGIPCLSVYDIDKAVAELKRCTDMGLKGALIWEVPDPELPLSSSHYDPLWAAAAEMGAPINLHILTGHSYVTSSLKGYERVRGAVNVKTADAINTIFDMVWTGVFERHPKLKVEMVESEVGFMPFILQQWDYYYHRFTRKGAVNAQTFPISRLPSEIFNSNFYATFMDDYVGTQLLKFWGDKNIMWSSDYPHQNMTWPNSRAFLARQVGDLAPERQKRILSQNVIDLYDLPF
jgi:predicted TIM-barrel fold metal-dependent hydrolase